MKRYVSLLIRAALLWSGFLFPHFSEAALSQEEIRRASEEAKSVLNNLYQTYGNLIRPCPEIVVVQDNQGPRYRESTKTIILDDRSIQICRGFGKYFTDALAFIIGHELAHFFQEEAGSRQHEFSYLVYGKNKSRGPEKERMADIQGIFNAYLAGYSTTHILPDLISRLYKDYQLSPNHPGYPPLKERQQASAAVLATVDTLTQLYEIANYLSALSQYELASACYQYILKYYPGREVFNNLGVSYALHAMNSSAKSPDDFLYPIEIDPTSRLKKPKARGGIAELPEMEQALRKELLFKAEKGLRTANRLDPSYFPADLNLLCVLALQGRKRDAKQYFRLQGLMERHRLSLLEKNKARLVMGIVLADSAIPSEKAESEQIFQDLASSTVAPSLAYMAAHNLKVMRNDLHGKTTLRIPDCLLPFALYKVDNVSIHRLVSSKYTALPGSVQLSFSLVKLSSSTLIQFSRGGRPVFNLQRIIGAKSKRGTPLPSILGKHPQIVDTPSGFFLLCTQDHAVFLFDNHKGLLEWCRYYLVEI